MHFLEKFYLILAWVSTTFLYLAKKYFIESSSLNKENVQKNLMKTLSLVETNITKIHGKLQS